MNRRIASGKMGCMKNTSLVDAQPLQQILAESLSQNISNWQTVVKSLPQNGCLLVTRLSDLQQSMQINELTHALTQSGTKVFVLSVDD